MASSAFPWSRSRRIEALRHHILRNIGCRLTVLDVAEYAHVSDRHLIRIFKTELGMGLHAYVKSVRVEKDRNELDSSDATLERIASVCGLGTVDTLVRAFRRRLNATSTEHRGMFRSTRTSGPPPLLRLIAPWQPFGHMSFGHSVLRAGRGKRPS